MSYANGTTHYNLPQTVGTDKRDWSDTNQAFADLDAAVYAANNDLSGVTDRVTALEGDNTENKTKISTNATDITTLDGRVTAVEHVANDASNGLADVRQDAEDMITSYNETSATSKHDYEVGQFFIYNDVLYKATKKISAGNTIVPNTNCEATNVTSALGYKMYYFTNYSTPTALCEAVFAKLKELHSANRISLIDAKAWIPSLKLVLPLTGYGEGYDRFSFVGLNGNTKNAGVSYDQFTYIEPDSDNFKPENCISSVEIRANSTGTGIEYAAVNVSDTSAYKNVVLLIKN